MDMSTAKSNLTDLMTQVVTLDAKFNIREFDKEIVTRIPIYKTIFDCRYDVDRIAEVTKDYTNEEYENCKNEFEIIKEKYNYEAYLKEGYAMRQQFVGSRKKYLMNKNRKFLEEGLNLGKSPRMGPIEKIAIDINQEYLFSRWLDNHLRNMKPKTMFMTFETDKGEIKEIEVAYRQMEISEDYVEAPLIDRCTGTTLFDRFLLHSFYNVKTKQHEYVPVKLIMGVIDNG